MRAISLDEAVIIINACFATAKERRLRPLTAVILDAGGPAQSGRSSRTACAMLRFEIAYGKAYAALSMGRPVAHGCCKKQAREAGVHGEPAGAGRRPRCSWKPAASSFATPPARSSAPIGVTGGWPAKMDDVCARSGGHPCRRPQDLRRLHRPRGGWRASTSSRVAGHATALNGIGVVGLIGPRWNPHEALRPCARRKGCAE